MSAVLIALVVLAVLLVVAGFTAVCVRLARPSAKQLATQRGVDEWMRERPPPGSDARAFLDRGAQVARELHNRVGAVPGFYPVVAEADEVVDRLQADARAVTALNNGMADVSPNRLRDQRDDLAARAAADPGGQAASALRATEQRLADVQRSLADRDAALDRMRATVLGLEATRDEVVRLAESPPAGAGPPAEPLRELQDRVRALRTAYAELDGAAPRPEGEGTTDRVRTAAPRGREHRSG